MLVRVAFQYLLIQDAQLKLIHQIILLENFYAEHRGKFFFNRLTTYMSSGPFKAVLLFHPNKNAIKEWRAIIGKTQPIRAKLLEEEEATEDGRRSLRALFGITDTRNSFHGSDSPETALRESKFFFPEFDYDAFAKKL